MFYNKLIINIIDILHFYHCNNIKIILDHKSWEKTTDQS